MLELTPQGQQIWDKIFDPDRKAEMETAALAGTVNIADRPSDIDWLSREPLAEYISKRLRHVHTRNQAEVAMDKKNPRGISYFVHIDGAWGSGKSTLLRFVKNYLENKKNNAADGPPWIVAEFNAWRHQRLNPPWWPLMLAVNKASRNTLWQRKKFFRWLWLNVANWWWKINTGTNYLWATLITLGLFVLALGYNINPASDDAEEIFRKIFESNPILKAVTFITFLFSLTKFLRTSLVPGSAKAAQQFIEESGKDPMRLLSEHFRKQVERTGMPLAVFVDDMDRCSKEYGVALLEGLQTIFSEANVVYVIAADRRWLSIMFESNYQLFASAVSSPAKPFGHVFLDKIFQMIIEIPEIPPELKKMYFNAILKSNNAAGNARKEIVEEAKVQLMQTRSNRQRMKLVETETDELRKKYFREETVRVLNVAEEQQEVKHKLESFVGITESNPRSMKRLINDIAVARVLTFLYDRNVSEEELVLWVNLKLRYPGVAEYFWASPGQMDNFVNGSDSFETGVEELDKIIGRINLRELVSIQIDGQQFQLSTRFLDVMKFETEYTSEPRQQA